MEDRLRQIFLLVDMADRAGVVDPWVKNAIAALQCKWNDQLYQAALSRVMAGIDVDCILPGRFSLPKTQDQVYGELKMGEVLGSSGIEFCFPIAKLPMHIFSAGSSGSGKSTFAKRLAEEAYLAGIRRIRIIDPKADDYIPLAQKYPDFLTLKWSDLRFNPLTPPANVPRIEWHQTIVGHLSQSFNFWQGAEALYLRHLSTANGNAGQTTLPALLSGIQRQRKIYSQKDAFVISTVVSRSQMLLDLFGEVITTDSGMLEKFSEIPAIISTTGLMTESESWFTEFLLLWEYMYRVYNPNKRGLALHIYDECQHRLFSNEKERKLQKLGASVISQLVDQARALNIGICSLSQEPSTLINAVINNSYLKVVFHLGSGSEVRVVREALGLTDEQAEMIYYLETGEAIVRMAGIYLDAIPVKLHDFVSDKAPNEQGFWEHQQEMKKQLLRETIYQERVSLPAPEIMTSKTLESTSQAEKESSGPTASDDPLPNQAEGNRSSPACLPLLRVWLNLKNPFLIQGALFEKAGIASGSAQAKIKKELIRRGLIIDHKLQIGKTFSSVWEPTGEAYDAVGVAEPHFNSKGGYFHQFLAHHIMLWAINQESKVKVEYPLPNGKAVDLVLRNDNELLYVEVAVSPPLEKEVTNIVKDFAVFPHPDKLIIAVVDNRSRERLRQIISEDTRLDGIRDRIEVKLAGNFIRPGKS